MAISEIVFPENERIQFPEIPFEIARINFLTSKWHSNLQAQMNFVDCILTSGQWTRSIWFQNYQGNGSGKWIISVFKWSLNFENELCCNEFSVQLNLLNFVEIHFQLEMNSFGIWLKLVWSSLKWNRLQRAAPKQIPLVIPVAELRQASSLSKVTGINRKGKKWKSATECCENIAGDKPWNLVMCDSSIWTAG